MKIVFFGCDDFAAIHLERLIRDGHSIAALVTQPDRPKGRGMHVIYSPTKELALQYPIEVFQPVNLKDPDVLAQLKSYGADVFVVVAYGKFLPEEVLVLPKYFCVNVHPSLLPKYRGAAPINWAVISGDTETGVTLIKINASMDGGDILLQETHPLPEDMTSQELREHLASVGANMLSQLLPEIPDHRYTLIKQDALGATRAPKMHKDLGLICWDAPAKAIHNLVRGTQPWPGAYTFLNGNLLKVLDAEVAVSVCSGAPGEIIELHKDGFIVQTKDGAVLIKKVHPASSKPMDARAFLAGHKLVVGTKLG